DVFCRRTELSLWVNHKKAKIAAEIVAELMGEEYKWTREKEKQEIEEFLDYIRKSVSFIN
ncbi:MAG: hypothetical protein ACFFFB_01665, partial [Candidatus Heimdallarchaeota archaeon]